MNSIIITSIKKYEDFLSEFQSRVDDIKLIEEMFLKYKSYGYTFKELNNKLRK